MTTSAGARFRAAIGAEHPLQVPGAVCAHHAIQAQRCGFTAITRDELRDLLGLARVRSEANALFAER